MAFNPSRGILAVVIATGLGGCSAGNVARPTVITFSGNKPYPKDVTVIPRAGVPRFVMGRRCPSTPVDDDSSKALYAFHPGVGSRLQLNTWSAGLTKSAELNRGNTYLPIQTPTNVSLRVVKEGESLVQPEEAILATFLTTSRTKWKNTLNNNFPDESEKTRAELIAALESHKAQLWNALVKNLCIQASSRKLTNSIERTLSVTAMSNILALCQAIPDKYQGNFKRAFISASDDNSPPCSVASGQSVYRSINGEGPLTNSWSWSEATLGLTHSGSDIPYLDNTAYQSPNHLTGHIQINSVRPWSSNAPTWTLQEWENSGICQVMDQPATIASLKLHGANRWLQVVLPNQHPSHRVLQEGGRRRLQRFLDSNPFAFKISRDDLGLLTAADVTGLHWKTGLNNPQILGCDRDTP
jgi:hypothetical protein